MIEKLERLGHRVGESLVERTSRDIPRFRTELDAVIFICKHFWSIAFNKPIDNLKTNHQVWQVCARYMTLPFLKASLGHKIINKSTESKVVYKFLLSFHSKLGHSN